MPRISFSNECKAFIRQHGNLRAIQMRIPIEDGWEELWIPDDPANGHYQAYQQWLAEGNEPRIIL